MITREAAIAARCVRYQKEEFLHDIRYSAGYHGETEPIVEWMIRASVLRLNLIDLGVTAEELHWIAWELDLQEEWYNSLQESESWQDPRVGTPFEV
jgi:hypothetical protein